MGLEGMFNKWWLVMIEFYLLFLPWEVEITSFWSQTNRLVLNKC